MKMVFKICKSCNKINRIYAKDLCTSCYRKKRYQIKKKKHLFVEDTTELTLKKIQGRDIRGKKK